MTYFVPFGVLCIAVTILIMVGLAKARDNKKTNRVIRNSERFRNIIATVRDDKEKKESEEEE